AEIVDSVQADEDGHASNRESKPQEQVPDLKTRHILRLAAHDHEVILADIAGIEVGRIEIPIGGCRFEAEPIRVADPPVDLADADSRLVMVSLRAVEAGARDRHR